TVALRAEDQAVGGIDDVVLDVRKHAAVLEQPAGAERAAGKRLAIGGGQLLIAGALGLRIVGEAQRRSIGRIAVARTEAVLVVDRPVERALQVERPAAGLKVEFAGDARGVITVAEVRIFALKAPGQLAPALAYDIGEQRIALHVIARRTAADQFDMIDRA